MFAPRLLVVDQEIGIRLGLETLLRLDGFDVRTAGDYWDAAQRIVQLPLDCLLTDVRLSHRVATNLNGLGLIRLLRLHQPAAKAILMAAVVDARLARLARELGAVGHLEKPFEPSGLGRFLRSLLPTGGLSLTVPPGPGPPQSR